MWYTEETTLTVLFLSENEITTRSEMNEEDIRYEIARLEREIGYCDETIQSVSEKIKEYHKNAEYCLQEAARGGGIGHTPEEMRKGAESWQRQADNIRWKITDAESKKQSLIHDLNHYRSMLSEAPRENKRENIPRSAPVYERPYTAPRRRKSFSLNDYLKKPTFMGINKVLMKESLRIVIVYEAAIIAILNISKLLGTATITGLSVVIFGPIVFAVAVRKLYLNIHASTRKALNNFVSYLLGACLTVVALFDISKGMIIWMIIIIFLSVATMDRMGRGWPI